MIQVIVKYNCYQVNIAAADAPCCSTEASADTMLTTPNYDAKGI